MRFNDIMLVINSIALVGVAVLVLHFSGQYNDLKEQVEIHNCAQHNPQTGEFEWKGGGE